jgi:hypothetical protein
MRNFPSLLPEQSFPSSIGWLLANVMLIIYLSHQSQPVINLCSNTTWPRESNKDQPVERKERVVAMVCTLKAKQSS